MSSELDLLQNENISRNSLHKIALSAIYDALLYIQMGQEINVENIVSSLCETSYEEADYFVKKSLISALAHYSEIKDKFNEYMRKWVFDRLNLLEQAILMLAYVHFFYAEENVEKRIVIDIAIKLSKTYLDEGDYKFVNAILDKVLTK